MRDFLLQVIIAGLLFLFLLFVLRVGYRGVAFSCLPNKLRRGKNIYTTRRLE